MKAERETYHDEYCEYIIDKAKSFGLYVVRNGCEDIYPEDVLKKLVWFHYDIPSLMFKHRADLIISGPKGILEVETKTARTGPNCFIGGEDLALSKIYAPWKVYAWKNVLTKREFAFTAGKPPAIQSLYVPFRYQFRIAQITNTWYKAFPEVPIFQEQDDGKNYSNSSDIYGSGHPYAVILANRIDPPGTQPIEKYLKQLL